MNKTARVTELFLHNDLVKLSAYRCRFRGPLKLISAIVLFFLNALGTATKRNVSTLNNLSMVNARLSVIEEASFSKRQFSFSCNATRKQTKLRNDGTR